MLDSENISVFGTRLLFGPNRKLHMKEYILLTYTIYLKKCACYLRGLFDFDGYSIRIF